MDAARLTAFKILRLVEGGGYAGELLRSRTAELDKRDAGLASELVYGVLRRRIQLDFLIQHYSGKPAARLDPEVRLALELGILQVRNLDRIPKHAAVDASVELVKSARKRSAAGFTNAVLRKVDRTSVAWPDRATALSTPEWLLAGWEANYGANATEAAARAFLKPSASDVNPETGRVQDPSAREIVPLLELSSGHRLLDLCAAPGNKTAQALALGARVIACDRHLSRLRGMDDIAAPRVALDATQPLPFTCRFDRILVDAPCTGTGTLGRNPEIKLRLTPEKVAEMRRLQEAILKNAVELLAPGGRLVYSTCSLERDENDEVAAPYAPVETRRWLPGASVKDGFFAAVITCG